MTSTNKTSSEGRLDRELTDLAVIERHEEEPPNYDCGDHCDMCIPDWRDREQLRFRLAREQPTLTIADWLAARAPSRRA